jgi:hypothetical protein
MQLSPLVVLCCALLSAALAYTVAEHTPVFVVAFVRIRHLRSPPALPAEPAVPCHRRTAPDCLVPLLSLERPQPTHVPLLAGGAVGAPQSFGLLFSVLMATLIDLPEFPAAKKPQAD